MNRIHFLRTRQKDPEGALKFAKEAYQNEKGADRSRILMEGASTAFQLYLRSRQKSHIQEMLALLNVVINERLPGTPDAYWATAQLYDKLDNLDRAVKYAREAERTAPDLNKAAFYYHEIVNLYVARNDHEMVVRESEALLSKYPNYPEREHVEQFKKASEDALEEMYAKKRG